MIICDMGSTHMGKKRYAFEMIDICASLNVDVVKFQMFNESKNGNVAMPYDWMKELIRYGGKKDIGITASTFDRASLDILMELNVPFIKFAHSQQHRLNEIQGALNVGRKVMVTTDRMNIHKLPDHENLIKLWTYTVNGKAEYPCEVEINFDYMFPLFDGFSDHSVGFSQAKIAVNSGAKYIEKHVTLQYDDITCPDRAFALTPDMLKTFMGEVRK